MILEQLEVPIVQAPLAGGPSTPELAAAVAGAGGLGFLAAGYKQPDAVRADVDKLRELSEAPFGLNVFAPPAPPGDPAAVAAYAEHIRGEGERFGVSPGEARHDDDHFEAKVELAAEQRVPIVSFTFGCPAAAVVQRVHEAGAEVWVTVTAPDEALIARDAGADVLVLQGFEAGGHRGYFADDDDREDLGLLPLIRRVREAVDLPLVAAGGIADGPTVAAVLCAGAAAAQLGSALMLASEAGTSEPHRRALRDDSTPTALTRAFSGRQARGIVNRFMREHNSAAPIAYPDVHHLTTPIRAAARKAGDAETINLWAGQAHALAIEAPAGEIVRTIAADARDALAQATARVTNLS
jgi:nitronate monooxygenase